MSVEYIDGVFFHGVDSSDFLHVTFDRASNQVTISQKVLDGLAGPDAGLVLDSIMYLLSDLRSEHNKLNGGDPVRITKTVAIDERGRVIQSPKSSGIMYSPTSIKIALEHLLSDINSGINEETYLSRFVNLRMRRDEWTPVMNGIDGLLEVIEVRLRK